jgi:F-type H+-transporting ATPase subunit delta
MKISKQAQREARQLFRSCLVNGVLDEARARQTVNLLAELQPRGYVEILSRLHRLVQLDVAKRTVHIDSAVDLSPAQKTAIEARLSARYGNALEIFYATQPALIGGLRVQVGSDLYDGTVKTRLDNLQQSF